ncbi:hypothetical protein ACIRN4_07240 [Pimelobacter simplex]|nr:hypothetical protein [Pimelobacter simplex]GEB12613.1 hypothetical protein NSI01_09280 [Pimelobacter simplex]SFM56919.1 hypothetical protein SAMN05421671_2419 [Pimelobacter simplex]
MNVNTLAGGVIGFLLGGLVVSTAASLEDDDDRAPSHGSGPAVVQTR